MGPQEPLQRLRHLFALRRILFQRYGLWIWHGYDHRAAYLKTAKATIATARSHNVK